MHRPTLADILRRYGPAYRDTHALNAQQGRAWRAIVACRTRELGGVRERCEHCGCERYRYRSCGNRHCPQCQTQAKEAWRAARVREVLPVPYAHWVFTLPHALNALASTHARWVFDTLFACASSTLLELAGSVRWLKAEPTVTLVLHTWGQDLRTHLHVHALVSCGGLDAQGRWRTPVRASHFLFPVKAASRLFRGKFIGALVAAHKAGVLDRDPARNQAERARRLRALREHDWVVYAKPPAGGPAQVLDYLARYTHRVAISNDRILGIDNDEIRLRVRPGPDQRRRMVSLPAQDFIARFMRHVLPRGFKRIRHYGLLAPRHKGVRMAQARAALQVPEPQAPAIETAQAFLRRVSARDLQRCPHCHSGRWCAVEIYAPRTMRPAPIARMHTGARVRDGPP